MRSPCSRRWLASLTAGALCVAGCSGWISKPTLQVRLESRGAYHYDAAAARPPSLTSDRRVYRHTVDTDAVRCDIGTHFGAIYTLRLHGGTRMPLVGGFYNSERRGGVGVAVATGGRAPDRIPLDVHWRHPLFVGSDGLGSSHARQEHWLSTNAAYPRYFGWELAPNERVNGRYELAVFYEGERVIHESFEVFGCPEG